MKCKYCGCTDEKACTGGCFWVKTDVCSNCLYSVGSLEALSRHLLKDYDIEYAVITFKSKTGEDSSFEIVK